MKNPIVLRKKTPNGGDYSEMWLLDKDGNPAQSKESATSFEIRELKDSGELVQSTYGKLNE